MGVSKVSGMRMRIWIFRTCKFSVEGVVQVCGINLGSFSGDGF